MQSNRSYGDALTCEWCTDKDDSVRETEYLPEGESFVVSADLCDNCRDSLEYVPEPSTTDKGK